MHSGGFVITFHQRMNVASPLSSRNRFTCCIVSFIWLNGTERLHRLAVLHQLEDAEQADVAVPADARVLGRDRLVVGTHHRLQPLRVADEVVVLDHLHRGDRGRHAQRVRVVREAAPEDVVVEVRGDLRATAPPRRAARTTT